MTDTGRRDRWRARERVTNRVDRQGCLTPEKAAYDLSDPDEAQLANRRGGDGMTLYTTCPCGFAHWGHGGSSED